MSTLESLRSKARAQYIKIDPNAKVFNNDVMDKALNDAQAKIATDCNNQLPEQEKSATITTNGGTAEYDLPADFLVIDTIVYNTLRLTKIKKNYTLVNSSSNTIPNRYYLYGGKLGLFPTPDKTYSIDYLYRSNLPTITVDEECILPSDFDKAIASYAAYILLNSASKFDKADRMLGDYTMNMASLGLSYLYDDMDMAFGNVPAPVYRDDVLY